MSLVSISRETLPQFVERVGGRASTVSVASRFGWDHRTARREMEASALAGKVRMLSDDEVGIAPIITENRRNGQARRDI